MNNLLCSVCGVDQGIILLKEEGKPIKVFCQQHYIEYSIPISFPELCKLSYNEDEEVFTFSIAEIEGLKTINLESKSGADYS